VQADAEVKAIPVMLALDQLALASTFCEQCEARVHGARGVVFAGLVCAEHRQQTVTRVLQDLAAVRLDDGSSARKCPVHHCVGVLRIQVLGERRGADDIEEEDGDLLESLRRCAGSLCGESSELGAQRSQCDPRHLVAE
jgi:hypothetical protein